MKTRFAVRGSRFGRDRAANCDPSTPLRVALSSAALRRAQGGRERRRTAEGRAANSGRAISEQKRRSGGRTEVITIGLTPRTSQPQSEQRNRRKGTALTSAGTAGACRGRPVPRCCLLKTLLALWFSVYARLVSVFAISQLPATRAFPPFLRSSVLIPVRALRLRRYLFAISP